MEMSMDSASFQFIRALTAMSLYAAQKSHEKTWPMCAQHMHQNDDAQSKEQKEAATATELNTKKRQFLPGV